MNVIKSKRKFILVILLIISSILLYIVKSDRDFLQKNMDLVYTTAVQNSMHGLSIDYNKIDTKQKEQYYYQTLYNLKEALDVFYYSTYKKNMDLFKTLDRLYLYLLDNQSESYIIEDNLKIVDFLRKLLFNPNDQQVISDFNSFLDSKVKILPTY